MLRTEIAGFRGDLITPDDEGYDDARRVFNGMVDRRPALIARCTSTRDVAAVVDHAREDDVPLAVYGGGHAVTGHAVCDDGIVADLRGMKGVKVNPETRLVQAQGGLNWGELDAVTSEHGLAVTGGRHPGTGVAGLALGSGSGWLERKHGFTCDHLVAAEVVLADGSVVTASEDENADLFWGLRGGGGNFGIVTRFDFRANPIPPLMWAGMLIFPHERAREVLQAYREFIAAAPDDVGGAPAFVSAPPEDFVPEPVRGKPVLGVICVYTGDPDGGEEAFRPILDLEPAVAMVGPMPYTAAQRLIEPGNPSGMQNYWTADFLTGLPDDAIDTLIAHTARVPSPMSQVILVTGGGAVSGVSDHAMAFGNRKAPWNIHYLSMWPDPAADAENIAWTRELAAAMKPHTTGRAYLNFLTDEGPDRVKTAFGHLKYAKLQALKDRYDPGNLFRLNQNIKPSGLV
ncbi:MAG TPA: FAD-binding oxidoreductase [Solirubrobacteraceae bacterium]|jgi:FAD/FMN-containing dehydrogenase